MKIPAPKLCAITLAAGIGLGLAAAAGRFFLNQRAKRLVIVAVAHEWWWDFEYPSLGIKHAHELHLPVGIPIHFELATADALHSFWLPGLKHSIGIAPDTPSELNLTLASTGHFYGNCDAGCGCGSVCMRFAVFADNAAQFTNWVMASRAAGPMAGTFGKNHSPPPCVVAESDQRTAPAANRLAELLEGQRGSPDTQYHSISPRSPRPNKENLKGMP